MLNSQNLAFSTIKTAIKNHNFFVLFVVAYCAILVAFSRYAPNLDDLGYFAFIYQNRIDFFTEYGGGNPADGRFNAFAFLDLLFLMQISKSPYLFFGFNALLFALFSALFLKILNISNGKSALNSIITVLLSLSIGFVIAFFGICYLEKIQIIWIAIFMLCTFFVLQKPTQTNQLLGIIALNIALYYKEPLFASAIAFGVILLLYARQNSRKDLQKYALLVICSALLYVLLYVLLVLVFANVIKYYGFNVVSDIWECVISDSIVVFTVCGVVAFRAYLVIFRKEKIEPFFDGFLCASFAYFAVFAVLKISTPYYLLPCYVFGIPSLLYFGRKYFCNVFIKIVLFLGLFGFLAQNLPSGIHKMIDLKAQGVQFHRALDFVASHLKENKDAKIFFEGIGSDLLIYGAEALFYASWFDEYLHIMYGAQSPKGGRLRAETKCYYDSYYCLRQGTPKSGDLIIANNKSALGNTLTVAQSRGELIYQSGFPTIPKIALMPFARYFFSDSSPVAQNDKAKKTAESTPNNTNYFALPLETYVFKVR